MQRLSRKKDAAKIAQTTAIRRQKLINYTTKTGTKCSTLTDTFRVEMAGIDQVQMSLQVQTVLVLEHLCNLRLIFT